MANNDKENKIEKFTKEAIGKTLNQFNKEIGMADLVEINKNQDRILNGILSQVNDENTEKTEKSNIITLDNSTDGIVELKEIQGDTNVNVSKIEEMPITHDIGDKEGNVFTLNEITKGAISIGEIQGNTMVNCNKDDKKELVLMKDLSTQGYNNITITEGVDGGKIDVALEGNTLVNVSKTKDSTVLPLDEELTYIYPSTQYTVQFVSDKAITTDITLGGTQLLAQSIIVGLNRISITTPATLVDNKLIIDGVGAKISNVVVTDTDREFMYFEGMKSVGECEELDIVSGNKNLWTNDLLMSIPGVYEVQFDGKNCITYDRILSGQIAFTYNFKPNTQYTFRFNNYYSSKNGTNIRGNFMRIMYTDGTFESSNVTPTNETWYTHCITSRENKTVDRILFSYGYNTSQVTTYTDLDSIQLEEGSTATDYIPHQSNVQQLTHEPLRSIGDIRDRYVMIDGDWYVERKCGVRAYQEGDKDNYKTDLINTVYPLEMPTYEKIDYNPLEVYSGTTNITTNSAIPTNITIKNHGFNCLLKPSTTYTISSNLGLNTVTTPSALTEDCLRFMDTDTSDITTMRDVLVLEGDWTTKADLIPANFSGIESAFEQELVTDESDVNYGKYKVNVKVVGKNLVDSIVTDMKHPTGKYVCSPNYSKFKGVIPLPRGTYRLSFERSFALKQGSCIFIWSNDGKKIQQPISMAFEIKPNDVGITWYCSTNVNDVPNIVGTHIQVESGTQVTAYESYKESDIVFYIDEPLRGVEGSKDKIYVKDDKVVVQRNCASVTFDGSDAIKINNINDKTIEFHIHNSINKTINNIMCICNTIPYGSHGVNERITPYETGVYITINKNKLNTQDVAGFKQWLSENPTTVVYQLAEPIYEEVEYSSNRLILDTFNNESFNNSTLFLDTNISPKLSFKPLYEELVYVKNSTKYYIQFNAVGGGEVVINLGGTELTTEIVEGYNCIPITTPNESTNLMTIIGQGITINEVVVSEVICGGYYEGIQSCFEEHMENGKYRILLRGIALDGSKVNGIKLYINESLRGIGDIKDRLCIKNGKLMVERKCGELVFDGSETWWYQINYSSENIYVFNTNASILGKTVGLNIICDKFKEGTSVNSSNNKDNEFIYYDGWGMYIGIEKNKLSSKDIIPWLNNNPIKIVYKVETPYYEEATNEYGLPIVFEGYENGIVYIDSAVTPTTHIKYTSNNQLATTLAEAEEQNTTTQEDINMNVVTYMMDIDMMLTDMEMSNDISVMAVKRDSSNENMLDRMSDEDKKVYRDNTVVMLEKMITANVLEKEDIEGRIDMYYNKNRISKEQYEYLKSLL